MRQRERSVGRNVMRKEWNVKGMEFKGVGMIIRMERSWMSDRSPKKSER